MTTDDIAADFIDRIEDAGLSQREAARLLGVSRVTVNRWARGHSAPTPAMLRVLLEVIHVLDAAIEKGVFPEKLPDARTCSAEERWALIDKTVTRLKRKPSR